MELNFPQKEQEILEFWKEKKIFERSISRRKKAKDFVFYEGPPTANAKPGIHHVLSRVFKDIICRYKTMQGFRVLRKAGWDTHGLPVELAIEKKLGLKNKKEIEKYGIAKFNKQCKESVWQYKQDWERLTERIGFWLDMEHPYITYENDYIETLWWIIKQIWQKGLLYKDYKVVPYCPRCGTSLSSHEVALGYKKIKEPAVYVKFEIRNSKFETNSKPKIINSKTFLLVWTTTPWTLPGNVAVAVNPEFTYVKVKVGEEYLILAKERIAAAGVAGEIIEEFKGKDLIGLQYERIFLRSDLPSYLSGGRTSFIVVAGDFVSLEEGTGLVHIAPAFGEDDMRVGKENNLPVILNVDEEGKFKKDVGKWAGMFVKDADSLIIKDLQERSILFKEELYKHDYPFCWRCDSPLLYYAKESWFIRMQDIKKDLIANNQKINWVPSHLKDGRFGEWLKELKDWAFSRERYWGTPLPIWQCKECGHKEVIGSKNDLLKQKSSTNKYYILRHGYSLRNHQKIISSWPEIKPLPLTKKGKRQIKLAARKLKKEKIDLIFSSDILRTRQTAEITAKELGLKAEYSPQLRDINLGDFNGKPIAEFYKTFNLKDLFWKAPPKGESWIDCKKRMVDFVQNLERKYKNKRILIVSHGDPLWLLEGTFSGWTNEQLWYSKEGHRSYIKTGELRKIDFRNMPYNEKMELDFHRPYIDEVKFLCVKCSSPMERVPEVVDVWFDSGSMPFASAAVFPADYICEGIDQTRGWFYTLLAISTLLGRGPSYKNVISVGHVLDEKGEKMSKSKGNVVDPWYIIEKYGADAVRWYFYTVNQPGDPKLFAEKDIDQSLKKFILILWNCFTFYQTYKKTKNKKQKTKNILDRWIISELNELIFEATEKLDKYDVTGAARAIEGFVVNDLSLWYIRRSRKRFEEAAGTLRLVLSTLSKLTAPFTPFLSEEIYRGIFNFQFSIFKSVHLENWPEADKKLIDKRLNQKMEKVREIVTLALAERAKAGIKVRQPLASLQLPEKIDKDLLDLIKDEVNVKEIIFGKTLKLDTKITQELKEEGIIREVVRQINEMRKKAGLKSKDKISIQYSGTPELNKVLEKNKKTILIQTQAKDFKPGEGGKQVEIGQQNLWLAVKKL